MSQTYLERIVANEISKIQTQAKEQDKGSYLITDEALTTLEMEQLIILGWIMENLAAVFPDYIWRQTQEVGPRNGILISWKRRKQQ